MDWWELSEMLSSLMIRKNFLIKNKYDDFLFDSTSLDGLA